MRILHIINNLNSGGAEKLLVDTLPLYKREGVEVEVLQLSNTNSVLEYVTQLREKGIPVHTLSNTSIYNALNVIHLFRFLKRNRFDVLHVHLFPAMYWVALSTKILSEKIPLVFTEHSTQNRRFDKFYLRFIDRFIYRSYDKVIAISEAIGSKLITWTGMPDRIGVIRNGVNTSHFRESLAYPPTFWEALGIDANTIKIMMTARFSYPKDHETVLSALSKLPHHYHIIFTGVGDQMDATKQMMVDKGLQNRVTYLGFRKDVPILMKSVDMNILSSKYEGMSGVSLEAMAAEKPFLGSDVPGINDVVPDHRFLFKAGSATALALKIEEIITNTSLQNKMIEDGIHYTKTMDVMHTIEQYKNLYYKLTEKKSRQ